MKGKSRGGGWSNAWPPTQNKTSRPTKAELAAAHRLYGGTNELPESRAAPVQRESAESRAAYRILRGRWYWPGVTHTEHARHSRSENFRVTGEGATRGLPDWRLEIPEVVEHAPREMHIRTEVLAACELKAPLKTQAGRPVRDAEWEWWLRWKPWEEERAVSVRSVSDLLAWEDVSRHGLRGIQAWHLQRLHKLGYATMVAYGAEELVEFFDRVAGERRAVEWV